MNKKNPIPKLTYSAGNNYMQMAINTARSGIFRGHGGPFGSVVVKDGVVIGRAHNTVLLTHDPTSHGEINAIRAASRALEDHDLSGCELYTTGEPCPMCLAACMWANISKVYYGCTIADNALIGFRDEAFDAKFGGRAAFADYLTQLDRPACLALFEEYRGLGARRY